MWEKKLDGSDELLYSSAILKLERKVEYMSAIDIKRKKGESFEAVFRRFTRRLQQSGKVLTVRGKRFRVKKATKNRKHNSALRRLEMGAKREYLLKTGKVKEEDLQQSRRR